VSNRGFARFAQAMGEEPTELERWIQAGLVTTTDDDEISPRAVEQVRLLQLLRARGFDLDQVAHLETTQPGLFARYAQLVSSSSKALYELDAAIAATGLDTAFVERVWRAAGFADQGSVGDEDDVGAWGALSMALAAGIPEDALVQLVRVYADSMARIAEAESGLFHFHVHERLRSEGLPSGEVADRAGAAIHELLPHIDRSVVYFHRKALARAVREDLVVHVAEDAGLLKSGGDTSGRVPLAVAFIDLARFTSMTQAMGDLVAADVLDRFSDLVRRAVLTAGGRVVKQIGDEFMLVFHDVDDALAATSTVRAAAAEEPAFLATRIGVNFGSVLSREGDFIGTTVNVAARVTAQATPHQLLITEAVRQALRDPTQYIFHRVGTRSLRGIDEDFELWDVGASARDAVVDPVCGMLVGADASDAPSAVHGGRTVRFCSAGCRAQFVANPAAYQLE